MNSAPISQGSKVKSTFLDKVSSIFSKFLAKLGNPVILILIVLLILITSGFLWLLFKYSINQRDLAQISTVDGSGKQVQKDTKKILDKLSKHMLLPQSEAPSIATITNIDQLKEQQAFFKDAQNGDILLVYGGNQRAIIYRLEKDLIVNVGSILMDGKPGAVDSTPKTPVVKETTQSSATTNSSLVSSATELTIEIRNGTSIAGLASKTKDKLAKYPEFRVVTLGNALKDYTKTLIIDQTNGTKVNLTKSLIEKVNGDVVYNLPDGESASTADILIIVAQ